jgi:hypothetical protein
VDATETLGVLAHRGGLLVQRPELTVGVVRAVSRLSGLEVELLARRPLDRRSAIERQQDIRAQRTSRGTVAPRRLLPAFDDGIDLRVGWLDHAGGAHWEFGTSGSSSSGDDFQGTSGPSYRTVFTFPPAFDQLSLVLAWPEIGFPETVITTPLPDRATVERGTTSIWHAPVDAIPATGALNHHVASGRDELAVEAGTIVAPPQVLHRGDHAAVALTRLTAVGSAMSMELLSNASGYPADATTARAFPPAHPPSSMIDDPAQIRANGPGASIAVIRGRDAFWVRPREGSFSGGNGTFSGVEDFTLKRPQADVLDLVVAWPLAGLHDVRVRISLDQT